MKKFLILGVFGYLAFNALLAENAATQTEPNGGDIEKNIEIILKDLQGKDKSETITRLLKLAEQIKAMNDARHEFSEALKIILVNLMSELKEMATSAETIDAIKAVVGGGASKNTSTQANNNGYEAVDPPVEEGDEENNGD